MKQTVLFKMETRSENEFRRGDWVVRSAMTKAERETVDRYLSKLRRPPTFLEPGQLNEFDVTLTRLSSGLLDDDNLRGALKATRDALAAYVGLDDRDPRFRVNNYYQQKCERGYQGVRIRLEDRVPGDGLDIVLEMARVGRTKIVISGAGPTRLGPESESGSGELPAKMKATTRATAPRGPQVPLVFRPSYALLDWSQDGSGSPVFDELPFGPRADPPRTIEVPVPPEHQRIDTLEHRIIRRRVLLERHTYRDSELGEMFLFVEKGANLARLEQGLVKEPNWGRR